MNNNLRELTASELDQVSGGGEVSQIVALGVAAAVGGIDAVKSGSSSTMERLWNKVTGGK